jgi:AraC-like DNA-binding protein
MPMMRYDREYPADWKDVLVKYRESYYSPVADFHEHTYYEINLILSGNVNILLGKQAQEGVESRIVLTKPHTPHFVTCKPDRLYTRQYLLFTEEFLAGYIPEWKQIKELFGESGRVVVLTPEQREFCKHSIDQIKVETNPMRQKLLILYLLSYIGDFSGGVPEHSATPAYVLDALAYIEAHYAEKITAAELAGLLYVGRTTLMTAFKRYTGSTLNEYIVQCRLKNAIELLAGGCTEQAAAEACGLGDVSGLIRGFKRTFGMTPRQYMRQIAQR